MIEEIILNKSECDFVLSLKENSIGYSEIKNDTRDYSEWLVSSNQFDFILPKLLKFGINSLPNGRIIKYNLGNYFAPHIDQYEKYRNRYKTLIVQLNDDYVGGELIVDNKIIKKVNGNCVLFDSKTIHSVSEIKSGIRYSLVFWLEYSNFNNLNII